MAIKLGNTSIGALYLGSTKIAQAYLGSTKIYESAPPTPTGGTVVFRLGTLHNVWGSDPTASTEPDWSNLVGINLSTSSPVVITDPLSVNRNSYAERFNGYSPTGGTTILYYPAFMYGNPEVGAPTWIAVPQTYVLSKTNRDPGFLYTTVNTTIAYTFGTYTGNQSPDSTVYFGFIETTADTEIDQYWSLSAPYGITTLGGNMKSEISFTWSSSN